MNQDAIWDHFQNEGIAAFEGGRPRYEFLIRQLRSGERVLNIGVGSGELEALAREHGIDIWTLDPSERAIHQVRDRLALGERAKVGYSQQIPFPDECFDVVILTEVLEHLDEGIRKRTIPEILRVLKQGGRFIGTVPARERLEDSEVVCPKCEHHFHRWGHQTSFDLNSIGAFLRPFFRLDRLEERFFNEWDSVGLTRRALGLVKKFLSWRGLGTYGTARHIFFIGQKVPKP